MTSLTATAIRYADLSDDPIAVIGSKDNRVQFAFLSDLLKQRRDLTWPRKNPSVPEGTATHRFNQDPKNVAQSKRMTSTALIDAWFDCGGTDYVSEEVVGLRPSYGLTLTILVAEPQPDPEYEEEESEEDQVENTPKRYQPQAKKSRQYLPAVNRLPFYVPGVVASGDVLHNNTVAGINGVRGDDALAGADNSNSRRSGNGVGGTTALRIAGAREHIYLGTSEKLKYPSLGVSEALQAAKPRGSKRGW